MLSGTLRKRIGLLAVTLIIVASIGAQSAVAANVRHAHHTYVSHAYARHATLFAKSGDVRTPEQ
jgi:hypothetical protein